MYCALLYLSMVATAPRETWFPDEEFLAKHLDEPEIELLKSTVKAYSDWLKKIEEFQGTPKAKNYDFVVAQYALLVARHTKEVEKCMTGIRLRQMTSGLRRPPAILEIIK